MVVEVTGEYALWLGLASVLVDAVIAVLLFKTVRDYAEVAKVSKLQAKHRFRPWVGPSGSIEFKGDSNGKYQYVITIKNYGEIPSASVIGMSSSSLVMPHRDTIKNDKSLDTSVLGPLLPYMEKRYWVFVESELMEMARKQGKQIFMLVYFSYEISELSSKNGYGIISQLDPGTHNFIHKDMWVDQENP
jgi:hypothetical protein